jgi:hypothetical protein
MGKNLGKKGTLGITTTAHRRFPPTVKPNLTVPLLRSKHIVISLIQS